MNKQLTDTLMHVLLVLSTVSILAGVIFKIQHYPYGSELMYYGLIAHFVIGSLEMNRLRKRLKELQGTPKAPEETNSRS
ncbi:hypothetical protein [Sunxiuqinia rutila]|uniref:hypothetical protein n=1 Tax=Sunxiuqinia rutila TaxID=1397841 RepID=UPI003D369A05